MWLSVAARPLGAGELWTALQVGASEDVAHIERLLTGPGSDRTDEARAAAAASLRGLLGRRISIGRDDGRVVLRAGDDEPAADFSPRQAHVLVTGVCMVVCSVTTLGPAGDDSAASLARYAWSFWGAISTGPGSSSLTSTPLACSTRWSSASCTDALVLLLDLHDFITGPVTVPARLPREDCIALVQTAQRSLERPTTMLSALVRQREYAEMLQRARRTVQGRQQQHQHQQQGPSRRHRTATKRSALLDHDITLALRSASATAVGGRTPARCLCAWMACCARGPPSPGRRSGG